MSDPNPGFRTREKGLRHFTPKLTPPDTKPPPALPASQLGLNREGQGVRSRAPQVCPLGDAVSPNQGTKPLVSSGRRPAHGSSSDWGVPSCRRVRLVSAQRARCPDPLPRRICTAFTCA